MTGDQRKRSEISFFCEKAVFRAERENAMTKENIKEYYRKLFYDQTVREQLKDVGNLKDPEEIISAYIDLAGKMGITLTEEDVAVILEEEGKSRRRRTETAAAQIMELPDEELELVAGGNREHSTCEDTYRNEENCWVYDGCDIVNTHYEDYQCHWHHNGTECKESNYL